MDSTGTCELVIVEAKIHQIHTIPKWIGNISCQKKDLEKKEAILSNGFDNTYELIYSKTKSLQLDTISQCIGNISCQKKDLEK